MRSAVIIPTYNEIDNIEKILSEILKTIPSNLDIVIVDDNSNDGTAEVIDKISNERIFSIHRKSARSFGGSYKDGFNFALNGNYDYIFEMDADFSHPVEMLPVLIEGLKNDDVVIGSRYIKGGDLQKFSIIRKIFSRLANLYSKTLTGLPVRDITSGFVGYRRNVLSDIDLDNIKSEGYGFQIEMKYWAYEKGFSFKEIPIIFVDRVNGSSKLGKKMIAEAFFVCLKIVFNKYSK